MVDKCFNENYRSAHDCVEFEQRLRRAFASLLNSQNPRSFTWYSMYNYDALSFPEFTSIHGNREFFSSPQSSLENSHAGHKSASGSDKTFVARASPSMNYFSREFNVAKWRALRLSHPSLTPFIFGFSVLLPPPCFRRSPGPDLCSSRKAARRRFTEEPRGALDHPLRERTSCDSPIGNRALWNPGRTLLANLSESAQFSLSRISRVNLSSFSLILRETGYSFTAPVQSDREPNTTRKLLLRTLVAELTRPHEFVSSSHLSSLLFPDSRGFRRGKNEIARVCNNCPTPFA